MASSGPHVGHGGGRGGVPGGGQHAAVGAAAGPGSAGHLRETKGGRFRQRVDAGERSIKNLVKTVKGVISTEKGLHAKGVQLHENLRLVASDEYSMPLRDVFEKAADMVQTTERVREDMLYNRFEKTIVPTLNSYADDVFKPCKSLVADLERALVDYEKKSEHYETLRIKNAPPAKLSVANQKLVDSKTCAQNTDRRFMELAEAMERQRVSDLKSAMQDYVHGQLYFHCRALERLSAMAELLHGVDPEEEARDFAELLRGASVGRLELQTAGDSGGMRRGPGGGTPTSGLQGRGPGPAHPAQSSARDMHPDQGPSGPRDGPGGWDSRDARGPGRDDRDGRDGRDGRDDRDGRDIRDGRDDRDDRASRDRGDLRDDRSDYGDRRGDVENHQASRGRLSSPRRDDDYDDSRSRGRHPDSPRGGRSASPRGREPIGVGRDRTRGADDVGEDRGVGRGQDHDDSRDTRGGSAMRPTNDSFDDDDIGNSREWRGGGYGAASHGASGRIAGGGAARGASQYFDSDDDEDDDGGGYGRM